MSILIYAISTLLFIVWVLFDGYCSWVWADGFRNPFQGAAANAQGSAFIAQADDPSAIHYNPAGMTQLGGIQHSIGVGFISPNTTFRNSGGVKVKNRVSGGPVGLPPPGQFFITFNLQDFDVGLVKNFCLGLGVESLFGFANQYPKNGPFAGVITRAQLPVLDIKPTMAYKINDYLSIGLGADIFTFASFIGEGHSERQSIALGNIPGTVAGEQLEINGSGTTAGLNASILLTPLRNQDGKPLLNFGFIWRSQAVLPLNGQLLANGRLVADASSTIKFTESYEWGLAGWPIRNRDYEWKLEADLHFVRWQTIRNFDTMLSNGVVVSLPQRWDNAISVAVGTEYTWLDLSALPDWEIAARAGYTRTHTPIPDKNFDPAFPDADNNTLSIGMGFHCHGQAQFLGFVTCEDKQNMLIGTKAIAIDLAFQVVLWEPRTVTGHPFPGVNGTYKTRTYAGMITAQVNF